MKTIIKKIKQFGILETIVLIIYIALILVIAYNHEYNEDEGQSWLIARDLSPIQIIQQMKYEGHSFLWHYILMPFAKAGITVEIQKYISCFFAIATVVLILKKSPFSKPLKILLVFSSGMIYHYSVMARPYCMIPFLLACISVMYKDKSKHPYIYSILLGLLAHTHLIMVPTSVMLAITFWGEELILKRKEQTKENKSILIMSLIIFMTFVIAYGLIAIAAKDNCELAQGRNITRITNIKDIYIFIKDGCKATIAQWYGKDEVPIYYNVLVGIVILLCIIGTKNNLKQATIFWSQFIFTIIVHSLLWNVISTRVFILIYTLMFWLWNFREDNQYKKKPKENRFTTLALIIMIIILAPGTYKLAYQDIVLYVATGKPTAQFIKENIPKDSGFIYVYRDLQQCIACYLDKEDYKIYVPERKNPITYTTWDKLIFKSVSNENIEDCIEDLKRKYDRIYIISAYYFTATLDNVSYELVFTARDKLARNIQTYQERFYVYEVYL